MYTELNNDWNCLHLEQLFAVCCTDLLSQQLVWAKCWWWFYWALHWGWKKTACRWTVETDHLWVKEKVTT